MEHRKKERKRSIEKKEREKSSKSHFLLKKGISIFWEEKIFSKLFRVSPCSPPPFTTSKTLFQIIWKFLTLLEPSLSLAIYLTWVPFFSYAWAPHIYPSNDRKKNKYLFEQRWGNTYQKSARVPKVEEPSYHFYLSE
jgi:hypothetical protein